MSSFTPLTNKAGALTMYGQGDSMLLTGSCTLTVTGAGGSFTVASESTTTFTGQRYTDDATGATVNLGKSRGNMATPTAVLTSDIVGRVVFTGFGGTVFGAAGDLRCEIIEPTPSDTAMGSSIRIIGTQLGALTQFEIARFEVGTGLSLFTHQVIDQNRSFRTPASTTTTAGLNLPQGVAPTTPVNGDLWMTSAGLFLQYAGATVGPFGKFNDSNAYLTFGDATMNVAFTSILDNVFNNTTAATANRTLRLAATNVVAGTTAEFSFLPTTFSWIVTDAASATTIATLKFPAGGSAWFAFDGTAWNYIGQAGTTNAYGAFGNAAATLTLTSPLGNVLTNSAAATAARTLTLAVTNMLAGATATLQFAASTFAWTVKDAASATTIATMTFPAGGIGLFGFDGTNWHFLGQSGALSEVLTPASATTGAGLNLPHGAAPTSPVNGDVWTTTAGLFARVNGATVGPFATSGGSVSNAYAAFGDASATLTMASTLTNVLTNSAPATAARTLTLAATSAVAGTTAVINFAASAFAWTIVDAVSAATLATLTFPGVGVAVFTFSGINWVYTGQSGALLKVQTIASTTTSAGLNLPAGAAPTSPVNGDVWTTSSGIFVQIAGATVGPLLSAAGVPAAPTNSFATFADASVTLTLASKLTNTLTNSAAATAARTLTLAATGMAAGAVTILEFQASTFAWSVVDGASSANLITAVFPAAGIALFGFDGTNWHFLGQQGALGEVLTPASTTIIAGLSLPHGAAPTSPVNGDVWTTTAGLFARINGATVGPLTAAAPSTNAYATFGDASVTLTFASTDLEKTFENTTALTAARTLTLPTSGITTGCIATFYILATVAAQNLTFTDGVNTTVVPTQVGNAVEADFVFNGTNWRFIGSWGLGLSAGLGANTFTGKQTTAASTTTAAGLNLPAGAAPTSPVNGDLWLTSAGLFAQIAGVTVGPFAPAGASLGANIFTGKQTTAASTTSAAGLNLPAGAAPTAPVNGDLWLTSAGLFAQIAGATVGPFAPAGASLGANTFTGKQTTAASTTTVAGFNLPAGAAPTSPVNGDLWSTSAGLFIQIAGATIGPLGGGATLGTNTFTGKQTTAASTTTTAGLNLPAGAAPTSPVNGDVWTTSAGMFARIAGATIGPFGTGGGGGSTTYAAFGDVALTASITSGAINILKNTAAYSVPRIITFPVTGLTAGTIAIVYCMATGNSMEFEYTIGGTTTNWDSLGGLTLQNQYAVLTWTGSVWITLFKGVTSGVLNNGISTFTATNGVVLTCTSPGVNYFSQTVSTTASQNCILDHGGPLIPGTTMYIVCENSASSETIELLDGSSGGTVIAFGNTKTGLNPPLFFIVSWSGTAWIGFAHN